MAWIETIDEAGDVSFERETVRASEVGLIPAPQGGFQRLVFWEASGSEQIETATRGSRTTLRYFTRCFVIEMIISPPVYAYQFGVNCGIPFLPIVATIAIRGGAMNSRSRSSCSSVAISNKPLHFDHAAGYVLAGFKPVSTPVDFPIIMPAPPIQTRLRLRQLARLSASSDHIPGLSMISVRSLSNSPSPRITRS